MISFLGRLYGWVSWQRVPIHEFRITQLKRETAIAFAYGIFYVFAAVVIGLLIRYKPLPIMGAASFIEDVWYALVFKIGLLLIVPGVWFFLQGYQIRDLIPRWKLRVASILSLVIAYIVGLSLNLLQGRFTLIVDAAQHFSTGDLIIRVGLGVILALLIAGIPEEVVYRGIVQTRLERLFGRIAAISITVLLFTAWHLPTRFLLSQGVEGNAGDLGSVLAGTGMPVLIVGLIFLSPSSYLSPPPPPSLSLRPRQRWVVPPVTPTPIIIVVTATPLPTQPPTAVPTLPPATPVPPAQTPPDAGTDFQALVDYAEAVKPILDEGLAAAERDGDILKASEENPDALCGSGLTPYPTLAADAALMHDVVNRLNRITPPPEATESVHKPLVESVRLWGEALDNINLSCQTDDPAAQGLLRLGAVLQLGGSMLNFRIAADNFWRLVVVNGLEAIVGSPP